MNTNNPFGSKIVLAENEQKPNQKKEKKQTDLVKIHLACIPSLEDAKEKLTDVLESIEDGELKNIVNAFVDQLEAIEERVLSLTMDGIKNARQKRQDVIAPQAITPGMISGSESIPEAPTPSV